MKKFISLITVVLLLVFNLYAQSPSQFNYQAIVKDKYNDLVVNEPVRIRIAILKSTPKGNVVYKEVHKTETDQSGLININIGGGRVVQGAMNHIAWETDSYFIKTVLDVNNDGVYDFKTTSQLLSVPYALSSKQAITAKNLTGGIDKSYIEALEKRIGVLENNNLDLNRFKHSKSLKIGDFAHGGIVFYIFKQGDLGYVPNQVHGLVCAIEDQASNVQWSNDDEVDISEAEHEGINKGHSNTNAIVKAQGTGNYAVNVAVDYRAGNYIDWFLPSKNELNKIQQNKEIINKIAINRGGSAFKTYSYYCSSTQDKNYHYNVWVQNFSDGSQASFSKKTGYLVRSVRAF